MELESRGRELVSVGTPGPCASSNDPVRAKRISSAITVLLGDSLVAQMVKNLPAMQETWVGSLGQEDPLEKGMATHSNIPPWRVPWIERAWRAKVHGVTKSWKLTQLV